MTDKLDLFSEDVEWNSPQRCDDCGRFVSASEALYIYDYGDYGAVNNVEVFCGRDCPAS